MNKVMKWSLIGVGGLIIVGFVGFQILMWYTKSHSPEETVSLDSESVNISVTYCRPSKKDRVIFGELVPYGKVWRTGANAATVVSVGQEVRIAGQTLPAGEYSLWTIPQPNKWKVIFNSETGQWGVKGPDGEDNRDPANDVLSIDVDVFPSGGVVEQFTIELEDAEGIEMVLSWDDVLVVVPMDV